MNERPSVLKIQDANRNFSRVEACARETGSVVLTMYKKPKYLVLDLEKTSIIEMTDKCNCYFKTNLSRLNQQLSSAESTKTNENLYCSPAIACLNEIISLSPAKSLSIDRMEEMS